MHVFSYLYDNFIWVTVNSEKQCYKDTHKDLHVSHPNHTLESNDYKGKNNFDPSAASLMYKKPCIIGANIIICMYDDTENSFENNKYSKRYEVLW